MSYQEEAERYCEISKAKLEESKMINDSLEGILEQSPKPSEELEAIWKSK